MEKYKIILASQSPRRKEILSKITTDFEIIPSDVDEKTTETLPVNFVQALSKIKADDIFEKYKDKYEKLVVIGSDTVVAHGKDILGKPKSHEHAFEMIKSFAGDTHTVFSGVTIIIKNAESINSTTFGVGTDVEVADMSDEEINAYIENDKPFDKAGAYAIQGLFAPYIKGIKGDYYNIVGFPIHEVYQVLKKAQVL